MKDIIYFINEIYDNWKVSTESSNFIKDCIYDMLESNEIDKNDISYQDIIDEIIDAIDELDNKQKYISLRRVLVQYPKTLFKDGIHKLIDNEIENYFKNHT